MNAWSHLPNAVHIDRVLASVKSNPLEWDQVWPEVWDKAWGSAWDQMALARQEKLQAWRQAKDRAMYKAWDHARAQARGVILALVAYDDCAKYLNLPIDQLEMLYHLTNHPACLLLQPAVLVFAKEKELA
jgi:hypothetical protein